jgi:hypothetical protein
MPFKFVPSTKKERKEQELRSKQAGEADLAYLMAGSPELEDYYKMNKPERNIKKEVKESIKKVNESRVKKLISKKSKPNKENLIWELKNSINNVKKAHIKHKSKNLSYDPERFTEGKNKMAQIEGHILEKNLERYHKPSTKVKVMKKSTISEDADINEDISKAAMDYVNFMKAIIDEGKVIGGVMTGDLRRGRAAYYNKLKPSDIQDAEKIIKAYKKARPKHTVDPSKLRGKGKKTMMTPEEKKFNNRRNNIIKYIKDRIDNEEFEATPIDEIEFIADEAMSRGVARMSIPLIEELKYQ